MSDTETQTETSTEATATPVTEPTNITQLPVEAPLVSSAGSTDLPDASGVSETPAVSSDAEEVPVFYSHLLRTIGQFLGASADKSDDEISEDTKHLQALFFQSVLLANAINSSRELTEKVVAAVEEEIAKVTAENEAERPAWVSKQIAEPASPIIIS